MVFMRRKAARRKSLQEELGLDEMQARTSILQEEADDADEGAEDAGSGDDDASMDGGEFDDDDDEAEPPAEILADLREGVAQQLSITSGTLKMKNEGKKLRTGFFGGKLRGGKWSEYWFALKTEVLHPADRVELLWYADADSMEPLGRFELSEARLPGKSRARTPRPRRRASSRRTRR